MRPLLASLPVLCVLWGAPFPSATAQRQRPDNEPRPGIYRARDGVWRVDLPVAMEDALDRLARDFEPWTSEDYRGALLDRYEYSPRQTPWAVIGDFNGDGRLDMVIAGRDDRDALILAVLSTGRSRYRAIRLDAEPYDPDDPRTIRLPTLNYVYPGKYVIDDSRLRRARELLVAQPAVQVVGGGRPGAVLYVAGQNGMIPYYLSTSPSDDTEPRPRQRPPRRRDTRSTDSKNDSKSSSKPE